MNRLNWQCCLAGSSKTAPKILIFFKNCHGCQTFILAEIHCYLSTLKSWLNILFLSGVFRNEVCWFMSNFQQVLYPVICMTHCNVSLNFLALGFSMYYDCRYLCDKGRHKLQLQINLNFGTVCLLYIFQSKKKIGQNLKIQHDLDSLERPNWKFEKKISLDSSTFSIGSKKRFVYFETILF